MRHSLYLNNEKHKLSVLTYDRQCLLTVTCFFSLKSKDGQQSHGGKKDPGLPNVRSFKEHSQRQAELRKQRVRKGSVLNMLDIYKSGWHMSWPLLVSVTEELYIGWLYFSFPYRGQCTPDAEEGWGVYPNSKYVIYIPKIHITQSLLCRLIINKAKRLLTRGNPSQNVTSTTVYNG